MQLELENVIFMLQQYTDSIYFHYTLMLLTSIAVGIAVMLGVKLIIDLITHVFYLIMPQLSSKLKFIRSRPPAHLRKTLGLEDKKKKTIDIDTLLKRLQWLVPEHLVRNTFFLLLAIVICFLSISACTIYLNNSGAGIVCGVALILIFTQIFTHTSKKTQREIQDQLPGIALTFGSIMEDTGNFRLALDAVAERSPEPSKSLFIKITQMLDHGIEPDIVFNEIPKAAGKGYPIMLKDLILDCNKYGTTVLPRFVRLANTIDTMQELRDENTPDVVTNRLTSIILHLGIIVLAFLAVTFVPDAKKYLIDDHIGQLLITLSFLSVIVAIITDRLWGDISE